MMESFISQAENSGMYVVESDNIRVLLEEYSEVVVKADTLCDAVDPETTPYNSKYEARKLLDQICNKLDATRTIATLDKKKDIIEKVDWRLAAARTRLGIISWECDEPHNAQTELELAANYYCPNFIEHVSSLTEEELDADNKTPSETIDAAAADEIEASLSAAISMPVSAAISKEELLADAMKCLNMLGILWAGRGRVRRSFYFLFTARNIYGQVGSGRIDALTSQKKKEMEDTHTHTLFYLAQAYGHIQNAMKSSFYCRATLQRQMNEGLADFRVALDWVKNSGALSEYYMSKEHYRIAAMCLTSTEHILKEKLLTRVSTPSALRSDTMEVYGDLHRRWVRLDSKVLKRAFDRDLAVKAATEMGIEWVDTLKDGPEFIEEEAELAGLLQERGTTAPDSSAAANIEQSGDEDKDKVLVAAAAPVTVFEFSQTAAALAAAVPKDAAAAAPLSGEVRGRKWEMFRGIVVEPVSLLCPGQIGNFEDARVVFLRATARIEEAKKIFVFDGCVTDHVNLMMDHSRLYHYLAHFETDVKRRLAMETRRVDMLLPLLTQLNKAPFEALHKQLSYELGETFLALLDIKLDKFRGRGGGEVDASKLKKAEIQKCNDYCRAGLAMFTHFSSLYVRSDVRQVLGKENAPFSNMTLGQLATTAYLDPDESIITQDEVRPYLNSHFLSCRFLSKVISPPGSTAAERSQWLVAALKRYTWLSGFARSLCSRQGLDLQAEFGAEIGICDEMQSLLPPKIDRMHYLGEGGLTL